MRDRRKQELAVKILQARPEEEERKEQTKYSNETNFLSSMTFDETASCAARAL